MIDKITTAPTEAAVGFLAGAFSESAQNELQGHPFIYNPISDRVQSLEHLLPAPLRQKTILALATTDAFCEYLKRFKSAESSIYVTGSSGSYKIEAILDHRGTETNSWQDHRAELIINRSESLQKWICQNTNQLTQHSFAEHLEDRYSDIVDPSAAEILEIANTLHVTRNLSVKSLRRGSRASNSIEYNAEQKLKAGADGSIELPTSFTIQIEPFANLRTKATIKAALRPRVIDDAPFFTYELQRVNETLDEALEGVLHAIAVQTSLPIYR